VNALASWPDLVADDFQEEIQRELQAARAEVDSLRKLVQDYRLREQGETLRAPEFTPGPLAVELFRVADRAAFTLLWDTDFSKIIESQSGLAPASTTPFTLTGLCAVCNGVSTFATDFQYVQYVPYANLDAQVGMSPSWRERQTCACSLNCSQRFCYHILTHALGLNPASAVYCTEQTTEMFRRIRHILPNAVGSEHLGSSIPLGQANGEGVRNEDTTRLTFADGSFDCVFSLEVMEHVPDYKAGFREMARCLKPGGKLLLTVPFHLTLDKTVVRASVSSNGAVTHLLPPIYHGDPINPKGVLCFNDFGWDMIDDLRDAGFPDATVFVFSAPHYGYVGMQYVILATRQATTGDGGNSGFRLESSPALVQKKSAIRKGSVADLPEELRQHAAALFQEGKWDEAESYFRKLTCLEPDQLHGWQGRIGCARKRNHRVLERILRADVLRRHPEWSGTLDTDRAN
jgi:SAM-dependent methyltransferase